MNFLYDIGLTYKEAKKFLINDIKMIQTLERRLHVTILLHHFILNTDLMIEKLDALKNAYQEDEEKITRLMTKIQLFTTCYNQLLEAERKVLYYSFFKNESDVKLSTERLEYCSSTIYQIKKTATLKLVEDIRCVGHFNDLHL